MTDKKDNITKINIGGTEYETTIPEQYTSKKKWTPNDEKQIFSNIPGKILTINVKKKQKVKKGECLLILEAMKMKNQILAPFSGTIMNIHVKEEENIPRKTLLLEFK